MVGEVVVGAVSVGATEMDRKPAPRRGESRRHRAETERKWTTLFTHVRAHVNVQQTPELVRRAPDHKDPLRWLPAGPVPSEVGGRRPLHLPAHVALLQPSAKLVVL